MPVSKRLRYYINESRRGPGCCITFFAVLRGVSTSPRGWEKGVEGTPALEPEVPCAPRQRAAACRPPCSLLIFKEECQLQARGVLT